MEDVCVARFGLWPNVVERNGILVDSRSDSLLNGSMLMVGTELLSGNCRNGTEDGEDDDDSNTGSVFRAVVTIFSPN